MARLIGEAYIVIYPQTDAFATQLKTKVDTALRAASGNVAVGVDPASLAKLKGQVDATLKSTAGNVKVGVNPATLAAMKASIDKALNSGAGVLNLNTSKAADGLTDIADRTEAIQAQLATLRAHIDDTAAEAALAKLEVQAEALDKALTKAFDAEDVNILPLEAKILAIEAAFQKVAASKISINDVEAEGELSSLISKTQSLRTELAAMRATVNDSDAVAKIAALQAQAVALGHSLAGASGDANLAPLEAELLKLTASMEALGKQTEASTGFFGALGLQGPGSLIHITDILNASLPEMKLFNGAIGDLYKTMSGNALPTFASHLVNVATSAHLTAEAAIEITAVWVPATLALAAWGAAATPTFKAVYKQLQNMNTASKATGQQFAALAHTSQSVIAVVKPSALVLFGEALYAVQNKSSTLNSAMKTLGQTIDRFGAEAAVAFDKHIGTFFTTGAKDAGLLMQSFASLGSIIGTLLKVMPGYAEVLLGFGNDLLQVAAKATAVIEPVLKIGLALHGALLYGGLFGTGVALAFSKIVGATTSAVEAVAGWAAKWVAEDSVVLESLGKVLLGLDALSAGPVIAGVAVLAGAFAAVVIYLKASKTAADQFNSSIENTVKNSSLATLQTNLNTGIAQTSARLVEAQQNFTAVSKSMDVSKQSSAALVSSMYGGFSQVAVQVGNARQKVEDYQAGLAQLTQQQQNVNSNLKAVAQQFGVSLPAALSLANGAQITSNQLMASGANNLATIEAQVGGYITELKVMTPGIGALNSALNALNVTSSAQVTDAQKLAQAYTSWIGIVTGGDSAFTTFEQNFPEIANAMSKTASSGATLTVKVGNLRDRFTETGASMNGTSQAALAVRQAFDAQIQSATTLYGNLQTMAAASGDTATANDALARSGKDIVAQLIPLAAGSKEATSEVYALAQIAGYAGNNSFASLVRWAGSAKGAEADLNTQQTILTESTANLTQAAKNLSAALQSQISDAEATALAKTQDLSKETVNLANAFDKSQGAADSAVQTYAGQFYESLIKVGVGSKNATDQVNAFLNQLGASPTTIKAVDAELAKLPTATGAAAVAMQNMANDTQQNMKQLQQLPAAVLAASGGLQQLQKNIRNEDQVLVSNTGNANTAKNAFIQFAEQGLQLTATQAQNLWKTQAAQNLTDMANKAGTTKSAFINLATQGLDLTSSEAQKLWTQMREQYLDTLVTKGDAAKNSFINLAKQGLDLTSSSATNLWNTMKQQYLDTLASKAGETAGAFQDVAKKFGLSNDAALTLWTSLQKLPPNVRIAIDEQISGGGKINVVGDVATNTSTGIATSTVTGEQTFNGYAYASGGTVPGTSSSVTHDTHLAAVKGGELIIPSQHAPKFRDMARKASIPGFASGGTVQDQANALAAQNAQIIPAARNETVPIVGRAGEALVSAMIGQLKAAAAAAVAASQAISLSGVSNASAVTALESAAAKAGWTGAQWTALQNVEMREAGFSLTATNPSSGAYGMAQFINGPSEYAQYGGNSNTAAGQAVAMVNYVKSRYGTPAAAWAHEQAFGWYSGGGRVKPYSAGGMISEPVFGHGAYSGLPYSFAEHGPEQIIPGGGNGTGASGIQLMTDITGQQLLAGIHTLIKLGHQAPYAYAQGLQSTVGAGVRRGAFATSG